MKILLVHNLDFVFLVHFVDELLEVTVKKRHKISATEEGVGRSDTPDTKQRLCLFDSPKLVGPTDEVSA